MPKAILICGKIASGKSTYAEKLRHEEQAVVLSVDEIMLSLFDSQLGNKHEEICGRTHRYLFHKSLEILEVGMSVILDWGFWQKKTRDEARAFYKEHGVACEFHYIDITDEVWRRNITKRNQEVENGTTSAYVVDDGLAKKCAGLFEAPAREEIDVWVVNEWY